MLLAFTAVIIGLCVLIWSADRFIDGAAAAARHFGMPPLLIGIVIIGFGTSAPEMVVSALASLNGNPGIALGNAYGSNITNIALILGLTALISPIAVAPQIAKKEMPVLLIITALAAWQLADGFLSRGDALVLLATFFLLMAWSIRVGLQQAKNTPTPESAAAPLQSMPLRAALFWIVTGMLLLIISSRGLVWGAVSIAQTFGVSDLVIGLTIVAVGTSLPELASSLAAIRKNEHDMALGNIIGSSLFNTLAVVGIAGIVHPLAVEPAILYRDMFTVGLLTLALFVMSCGFGKPAMLGRIKGALLLSAYIAYNAYLISSTFLR